MDLHRPGRPEAIGTKPDLARELTYLRPTAGLSVRELAHRLDVPPATVGDYCSGRHLPSPSRLPLFRPLLAECGLVDDAAVMPWIVALVRLKSVSDARRTRRRRASGAGSGSVAAGPTEVCARPLGAGRLGTGLPGDEATGGSESGDTRDDADPDTPLGPGPHLGPAREPDLGPGPGTGSSVGPGKAPGPGPGSGSGGRPMAQVPLEDVDDTLSGQPVPVGVDRPDHGRRALGSVEEGGRLLGHEVRVGVDGPRGAGRRALGSAGGTAEAEDRLAQRPGLFLDATSIGEDEVAGSQRPDEGRVAQRVDHRGTDHARDGRREGAGRAVEAEGKEDLGITLSGKLDK